MNCLTLYCCGGSWFSSCDNPLSCVFGTLACGGSSQSRNGSSWQSSRLQSASLAWPRSVCTKHRIMGDYCCWPLPQATPTWWANWPRGQRGMERPMWPSSHTSCKDGECVEGKGAVWACFNTVLVYFIYLFHHNFCVFSQIGQMSGPSHQNRSVARGCILGKNISAQPCVKVELSLLSVQHMPECYTPVNWLCQ